MAAHKYWQAYAWGLTSGDYLQLAEFQLYNASTRIDSAATLTSSIAPSGGSLAILKNGLADQFAWWTTGGQSLVLTWDFPSAVEVTGIAIAHRSIAPERAPFSGLVRGGNASSGTNWPTVKGWGGARLYGETLSPVVALQSPAVLQNPIVSSADYSTEGGRGIITDTVKTKASPADIATFARVRLVRERDGKVIQETWSDPVTGAYTFSGFNERDTYSVTAYHPAHGYRAVIADNLTPGVMA